MPVRAPPPRAPPRKKKKHGWVSVIVLGVVLLLILLNLDLITGLLNPNTQYVEYPKDVEFDIVRQITISGTGIGAEFRIPKADDIETLAGSYLQRIYSLNESHTPPIRYEEVTEAEMWGSGSTSKIWMHWELPFPSSGTFTISTEYHVYSRIARWHLEPDQVGTVDDIASSTDPKVVNLRDAYLGDEWKIRPSNATMKALAQQMMEGTGGNVYLIVKNTYKYMRENYAYYTSGGLPQDCYETYATKKGDCDDQSILMASILRAAGIPAWLELGLLYDSVADQWGGHAWLKVYIPIKGSDGRFDPDESGTVDIDVVNNEFLFRDPYRFAEWESDGDGDHLRDYYQFGYNIRGNANIDVTWTLISMKKSSETERLIITDEEPKAIPGFEGWTAATAISIAGIIILHRKKRPV